MTRYILIDSNSGYVWGDETADSPVGAARLVDEGVGEYGRSYTEEYSRPSESHYIVYEAADDTPEITNGQDDTQIAIVDALPIVARVVYSNE